MPSIKTAFAVVLLVMAGCNSVAKIDSDQFEQARAASLPAVITINQPGITPEGIDYDNNHQRWLTGSVATGKVFEITMSGELIPFINDPDISASIGIEVDEARQRLLVVNSNINAYHGESKGHAKLGVYNLTDGTRIAMVNLGSADPNGNRARLANDVTVDDNGNIYVTDSLARVIYKVDTHYNATVLLGDVFNQHEHFMLNGLVAYKAEFLLVAESLGGVIYKIPLSAPENFSKVSLDTSAKGADGITWHANGNLLIPANSTHRLIELNSTDSWRSAQLVRSGNFVGLATTLATVGDAVYGVDPMFNKPETLPIVRRISLQ